MEVAHQQPANHMTGLCWAEQLQENYCLAVVSLKQTRGEDALTHASLYYNLDVVQLKADNDRLSAQLERDSAGKETLEREVRFSYFNLLIQSNFGFYNSEASWIN